MNSQMQVLQAFKGDFHLELKKSEIKKLSNVSYYYNTDKHLGDMLFRMVQNGSLEKVRHGYYKLKRFRGLKHEPQQENQTKLGL